MPIYRADEMVATPDVVNPNVMMKQFGGDLIKVGIVSYEDGEAPPPHSHPNDEQWIYMLLRDGLPICWGMKFTLSVPVTLFTSLAMLSMGLSF